MIIKDCPFCGGEGKLRTSYGDRNGPGDVWVQCLCCGARVGSHSDYIWKSEKDPVKQQSAIDRWNTRV